MGRPEGIDAMTVLGNGLFAAEHYEDALPVQEAELSTRRRIDSSEKNISLRRTTLQTRIDVLGGSMRFYACGRKFTLDV